VRDETLSRLDQKILRLRTSIETGQRRIIDLKQGAIQANAVRREQSVQAKMVGIGSASSVEEAEELIAGVLQADDPFEHAQIVSEINADLTHDTLSDRMADAGFGPNTRSTADDVLKRLKAAKA
jgi:phage shock protein A